MDKKVNLKKRTTEKTVVNFKLFFKTVNNIQILLSLFFHVFELISLKSHSNNLNRHYFCSKSNIELIIENHIVIKR